MLKSRVVEIVQAFPVDDDYLPKRTHRSNVNRKPVKSNAYRTVKIIYPKLSAKRISSRKDMHQSPRSSRNVRQNNNKRPNNNKSPNRNKSPNSTSKYKCPTPSMNVNTNILLYKWLSQGKISCFNEGLDKLYCKKCNGKYHCARDCGVINDNYPNTNVLLYRWLKNGTISTLQEGFNRLSCRKCKGSHVAPDCRFTAQESLSDTSSDSSSVIGEVSIQTPYKDQGNAAHNVAISLQEALAALDYYKVATPDKIPPHLKVLSPKPEYIQQDARIKVPVAEVVIPTIDLTKDDHETTHHHVMDTSNKYHIMDPRYNPQFQSY